MPALVQKSWNGLTTNPLRNTVAAQKAEATGMIRTRATRSASAAMGTAPSTTITPAKPSTPIRTVSLMSREAWMSGASTRMALGISSITLSKNSTSTMAAPPARSPSRKGHGGVAHAGQQVVGQDGVGVAGLLVGPAPGLLGQHRPGQLGHLGPPLHGPMFSRLARLNDARAASLPSSEAGGGAMIAA